MQLMNMMMDKQESHESLPSSPVILPRLDRLDRLLQLLEEKHMLSGRHPSNSVVQIKVIKQEENDDHCKTLSSALEEVQQKGTLMERLTMLENRVLKLSMEMDEGNTSKSSSSTISTEKIDQGFKSSSGSGRKDEMNEDTTAMAGSRSPVSAIGQKIGAGKNGRRKSKKKGYTTWLGWFHLGCN